MDSYLQIAEDVLRLVRRPLSAIQILRAAYEHGIAPAHLRGRTQQKTMGARLSEDILRFRESSRFYRTAPGRFLLRELADDPTIPEEMRRPIVARRRRRDLAQNRSLAFDWSALKQAINGGPTVDNSAVLELIGQGRYHYTSSSRTRPSNEIVVWAFMLVIKDGSVLTYRQGHYRENRDTFMHRRTIGFYTPVTDDDLSLFDQNDHGIVSSGIRALAMDLDLQDPGLSPILETCSRLRTFVVPSDPTSSDLLAVVSFACPDWLDPTTKRLAINDLEWMDLRHPPNHREDFDPWSQTILYDTQNLAFCSTWALDTGVRTQRRRNRISLQEATFIELALQSDSPITRKQALQRLCDLCRHGGVLTAPKKMKGFVLPALVDPDSKVRRWGFNTLAQIGEEADVALMLQPWRDNRSEPDVFAAGLTALANLVQKEKLLSILNQCDVELDVNVLMALGQQTDAFLDELSKVRLELNAASVAELTQATLLIGLKKAPDTLFSGRFPVSDVIGDLNSHDDCIVAQYSFWATVEHPSLGIENIRVAPANFSQLPPNVQGWAYRTLTKDGTVAKQHYDLIVGASESPFEAVREGVAIGLRNIFYDSLDVTVADWFLEEKCPEVQNAILDHMATHITKSSAYRDEVLKAYREAGPNSIIRPRLEAANRDDQVALEMRKISLQMNDPMLFASMIGTSMNNTMNFNGPVSAGGISNSGTGNAGQVQIISSGEALEAVKPLLKELLQALEGSSAPPEAAEGAKLTKEAVATPTKGNVAKVIDWLKQAKEGGEALTVLGPMIANAYDKLGAYVAHLPAMLG